MERGALIDPASVRARYVLNSRKARIIFGPARPGFCVRVRHRSRPDHQMQNQEQLVIELKDQALADTACPHNVTTMQCFERRLDGPQDKGIPKDAPVGGWSTTR